MVMAHHAMSQHVHERRASLSEHVSGFRALPLVRFEEHQPGGFWIFGQPRGRRILAGSFGMRRFFMRSGMRTEG